jgi:hypothetical protein
MLFEEESLSERNGGGGTIGSVLTRDSYTIEQVRCRYFPERRNRSRRQLYSNNKKSVKRKQKDDLSSSLPPPMTSRVALENHEGESTVTDPLSEVTRRSFHIVLSCSVKGECHMLRILKTTGTILPSQQQIQKSE